MAEESVADDMLRNGYDRWYRLEEEKAAIGEDLKELFAELKGNGFTPKALRESFRRVRNIDDANQQEHDAIVDLYVASLTGARPARKARVENIEQFDADGVEIEPQPAPRAAQMPSGAGDTPAIVGIATSPAGAEGIVDRQPIQPETANELLGGLPVAAAEFNAEETGRNPADAQEARMERGIDQSVTGGESAATNVSTLRQPKPLRPNCLKPDACGGQGRNHCWSCTKAMNEAGAA